MFGKGAAVFDTRNMNEDELLKIYRNLSSSECIIEEVIKQNDELGEFNNTSVNTLRVVTLICSDNKTKIMAAVLRMGRDGKTVDNFHHNGLAGIVDIENGIINAPAIDRIFKRYLFHPDSKKQIIGYRIPCWDKVIELVVQAANVIPDVRYVGWDIAIDSNNNIQIIEGNFGADTDVTQMPCREDKWVDFKCE